jgi:hypothetical protein
VTTSGSPDKPTRPKAGNVVAFAKRHGSSSHALMLLAACLNHDPRVAQRTVTDPECVKTH